MNSSPGATVRRPTPEHSAFVGAVIGSKQMNGAPGDENTCAAGNPASRLTWISRPKTISCRAAHAARPPRAELLRAARLACAVRAGGLALAGTSRRRPTTALIAAGSATAAACAAAAARQARVRAAIWFPIRSGACAGRDRVLHHRAARARAGPLATMATLDATGRSFSGG